MNKRSVLAAVDFGQSVAEAETEELTGYFVETDQWLQLRAGKIDVVYGAKGSGKSALYALLLHQEEELKQQDIWLVTVEKPTGAPAFQMISRDPPSGEDEFCAMWKLYFLVLVADVLREWDADSLEALEVSRALEEVGLLQPRKSLVTVLRRVRDYVRRVQGGHTTMVLDPGSGHPIGLTTSITLSEPPADAPPSSISIDALLELADTALGDLGLNVWLLADRLDVAFTDPAIETRALRALFRCYADTLGLSHITLKLFLRNDIWERITEEGFREASHIVRSLTLTWDRSSLLHLVCNRVLKNTDLAAFYGIGTEGGGQKTIDRDALINRILPMHLDDARRMDPFDWVISAIQDGSRNPAPRELIQLLAASREAQLKAFEVGQDEPEEGVLLDRANIMRGLEKVSQVRLEQTLFAEYPEVKPLVKRLAGEPWELPLQTLANVWRVDAATAETRADALVDVGFFERRGPRRHPDYWVPLLYRPALRMDTRSRGAFIRFGRDVVDAAAHELKRRLAQAHYPRRIRGVSADTSEETFLEFRGKDGQRYVLWLFAAESGSENSLRDASDVVAAGVLDGERRELDKGEYAARFLGTSFQWRGHFNSARCGYRTFLRYDQVQGRSVARVAVVFADRVLIGLRAAKLIALPPGLSRDPAADTDALGGGGRMDRRVRRTAGE